MGVTVTILGCGSSGGVPRPGAGWGVCDPQNPRNRRRRCSILVEAEDKTGGKTVGKNGGKTSLIVDTSPDLREQLLDADIRRLDAVLYTHDHADHTHGIDDLRALVLHMRRKLPVYADSRTMASLHTRFGYVFETPAGSAYPPILDLHHLRVGDRLLIEGEGPVIEALPFEVEHGPGYDALGFRFGDLAYLPDVSLLPSPARAALADLDVLILDCLRETPHPTHFHMAESLATIEELAPRRAILTNLHSDLDYAALKARLPKTIDVAYDGMVIRA